ncbi:MAG: multicopper oxidase domain-containing protein, partial [Roseibium sp.]
MNRRQFLASVSATAVLPLPSFAGVTPLKLKAETVSQQILPEGEGTTAMLGFNGSMPGPEIRLRRGARASIEVKNAMQEGTAVHWHGIRLENRMDGVPVLTQDLIDP